MASKQYEMNIVHELPVGELILNDDYQPRTKIDASKLKELATSIRKSGQQAPIWFKIEEDKPVLVAGHRRYKAIKEILKQQTIRGIRIEGDPQEIALIENVVREGLTALEEAKAYKKLVISEKFKQKDIAAFTGKAESTISETLSIIDKIKDKLLIEIEKENPSCPRWVLLEVAKEDVKKQKAVYKRLNQKGLTREEYKKGVTKTPVNMPVYMAGETAKKLASFDYSDLPSETHKKFVANLKSLRKITSDILNDLGELEPEGDGEQ